MRLRLLLVAGVMASVLSACTVPINGLTGVSVDADGHLMLVLAWCGPAQPDGVMVYDDRLNQGEGAADTVDDANYVAPRGSGQQTSFRLDSPDGTGWRLEGNANLHEGIAYTAFGGTADNRYATSHVRFRLGDAKRLRPGVVLVQDLNDVDELISQDEFERRARDPREVECG